MKSGAWPDKTIFILETRRADSKGSINQAGSYQDSSVMSLSAHVKDEKRFPGKWAFFGFGAEKTAKMIPPSRGLLFLPHIAWGGGQHICAVLSDLVAGC